jgi:hypothetical protein
MRKDSKQKQVQLVDDIENYENYENFENKSLIKFIILTIIKCLKNFPHEGDENKDNRDNKEIKNYISKLQSIMSHFKLTDNTLKYIEQVLLNEEMQNLKSTIQIFKTCKTCTTFGTCKSSLNKNKEKSLNISFKDYFEIELERNVTPSGWKSSDM